MAFLPSSLNKFRNLFFTIKLKNKFRRWLWEEVRQKKIMEYYSPKNLNILLEYHKPKDMDELDEVINSW